MAGATAAMPHRAHGQTLTWDPSQNFTGSDGSGSWNYGSGTFWANGTSDVNWDNTVPTTAIFGSGGTGSYNITVGTPIVATGMNFLAGPALYNLSGSLTNAFNIGGGTINFSTNVNLNNFNLSGSGGITLNGSAGSVLTLTGSGNYQDSFTGTLNISGGGTVVSNLSAGGFETPFNQSQAISVTGASTLIVGTSYGIGSAYAEPILTVGTGSTVTFNGGGTYTGGATLTGATINGSGSLIGFYGSWTTLASSTTSTISIPIADNYSNLSLNVAAGITSTGIDLLLSGVISGGSGGITKTGAGVLEVTGADTFTGTSYIQGGSMLLAGGNNRLPVASTLTLGTGTTSGQLQLQGITQQLYNITTSGTGSTNAIVNNGSTGSTLVIGYNSSTTSVYTGLIGGSGTNQNLISLAMNGSGGSFQLSNYSTFTGGTTVNAGTLLLGSGGSSGTIRGILNINTGGIVSTLVTDALGYTAGAAVTTINISGGTLNDASSGNEGYITNIYLAGGTITSTGGGAINFSAGYGITSLANSSTSVISAPIQIRGGSLGINTASGTTANGIDLNIPGAITDNFSGASGGYSLTKTGAGLLAITGTDTYTGGTIISAGTLQYGDGTTGHDGSSIATGGILDNSALIYDTYLTQTYSGLISGSGMLAKTGLGLLTLTGADTYTGGSNIANGKLYLNGSLSATGLVTVASGATLGGLGTINGTVNVSSGGIIEAGQNSTGKLTIAGLNLIGVDTVNFGTLTNYTATTGINVTGSGLLNPSGGAGSVTINIANLSGISIGTNYKLISYNGSIGTSGFAAFTLGTLSLPSRDTATLVNNSHEIDLTITSNDYLIWTGVGNLANGWDTVTSNWNLNSSGGATTYIDSPGDTVLFDDTAGSGNTTVNINTAAVHPNSVTFNNSTYAYTIQGTYGIAGSTGITKNGTAMVTFNTSNSFTGPVAVNAGILNIENAGSLGSSSGVTVASGAALQMQGGISTTNAVALSLNGSGGSTNGALENVSGTNTYSGLISLAGPATIGSDAGSLALTGVGTINGSGYALTLAGAGNGSISSIIGIGAGTVLKTGAGTWNLSGANTYTGATNVSAGTLIVGAKSGADTSYTIASGAVLQIGYSSVSQGGYGGSIVVNGSGVAFPELYFKGGTNYDINNGFTIQGAPTTVTTFGTGNVGFNEFDTNSSQVQIAAAASGTVFSSSVYFNVSGYGLNITVGSGANNSTGDLTINGLIGSNPYGGEGLNKYGTGSLLLTAANTYNYYTKIGGGSIILSGGANRLPISTVLEFTAAGTLNLNSNAQQVANLNISSGATATLANGTLNLGSGSLYFLGNTSNISLITGGTIQMNGGVIDASAANGSNVVNSVVESVGSQIIGTSGLTIKAFGNTSDTGSSNSALFAISNTSNSFTGGVNISTGLVNIIAGDGIFNNATTPSTNVVTIQPGAGFISSVSVGFNTSSIVLNGAGNHYFRQYGAATMTLTGVISDGGTGASLYQVDTGILLLTNAETYTGGTTIGGGTLQLGDGTSGHDGSVQATGGILDKTKLIYDLYGTETYAGTISGAGTVIKTGAGTLTLSTAESYTGLTNISGGTLNLTGSIASGSTVTVYTAGTLTGTGTVSGNAAMNGSAAINFTAGGNIVGTLGITGGNWDGVGTVTGLATNTVGNFNIGAGANLTATAGLNISSGTLIGTGTLTGSLAYTSGTSDSFGGVIAGGGSTLTMNNSSATLTLSGANTYGGNTTVSGGTVTETGNDSGQSGAWLIGPGSAVAATVNFSSTSTMNVSGSTGIQIGVVPGGASVGSANQTLNSAGIVNDSGPLELGCSGYLNITAGYWNQSGAMTLQPANGSGFSAYFAMTGGTFNYSNASAISVTPSNGSTGVSSVTIGGGTFYTSQGFADNLANTSSGTSYIQISGGATLELTANVTSLASTTGAPLTFYIGNGSGGIINTNGFNTSTSLVLTNVSGQAGLLTKNGLGMLTLTGANTYTGGTVVNAGTLNISGGSIRGPLTINPGAIVDASGFTNFSQSLSTAVNPVTINGGTLVTAGGQPISFVSTFNLSGGTITGSSGICFNGTSGINILSNTSTSSISAIDGYSSSATIPFNVASGSTSGVDLNITGGIYYYSGTVGVTKNGNGNMQISGGSSYTGATIVNAGTFTVTGAGSPGGMLSGTPSITVNAGATLNMNGSSNDVLGYTPGKEALIEIDGTINNIGQKQTIENAITMTGGTLAGNSTGSYELLVPTTGLAFTATSDATGPATVTGNLTLGETSISNFFNVSQGATAPLVDMVVNSAITNFGSAASLTKNGNGVLKLAGANTYTGGTIINGGTLTVTGSTSGTGLVTVNSTGALAGTGTVGSGSSNAVLVSGGTITAGSGTTVNDSTGTLTTGTQNWSSGTYIAKISNVTGTNDMLVMSGLTVATSGFNVSLLASNGSSPTFTARNSTLTATGTTPVAGSYVVLAKDTSTNTSTNPFANQSVLSLLTLTTAGVHPQYGDIIQLDTMAVSGGSGGYDLIAEDVAAPEPASFLLLGAVVSPMLLGRRRRRIAAVADV